MIHRWPRTHELVAQVLLLVALLTSVICASAQTSQEASVVWGAPLVDKVDGVLNRTIAAHDGAVIQIMTRKKEYFLQRMNAKMEVLSKQGFEYEMDGKSLRQEDSFLFGDEILLFASRLNKAEYRNELFVQAFDAVTLSAVSDWKMISSQDIAKKNRQADFGIEVSPNHAHILVYTDQPWEKGGPERVRIEVLDKGLERVWAEMVTLKYADRDFDITQHVVDDDGTVMLLGVKDDKSRREIREDIRAGKSYYEHHLFVFDPDDPTPMDYALRLGDKFLQEMNLAIPWNSKDIICSGFYSDEGTNSIKGFYYMKLDRITKEVVHSTYHEFEEEFVTMYMTEKSELKAKKRAARRDNELELADFEIQEVIINDSGAIRLIAEQYDFWQTTITNRDMNGMLTTTTINHYLYRDLMVLDLSPDGELRWKTRIPKRQYSTGNGGYYSSYCSAIVGDELYFIFNDDRRNLNFKKGDVLYGMNFRKKSGMISLVHLNGSGEYTRKALPGLRTKDMLIVPKKSTEIDGRLLLVAENRKRSRFARVDF